MPRSDTPSRRGRVPKPRERGWRDRDHEYPRPERRGPRMRPCAHSDCPAWIAAEEWGRDICVYHVEGRTDEAENAQSLADEMQGVAGD